jgi:hypothetical protein
MRYDVGAGWSSLVARWAHNPKVEGSNPSPATKTPFLINNFQEKHKEAELEPATKLLEFRRF